MNNYEILRENLYPAHQYWLDGSNVYAKGNFIIQTTKYKDVLNTNKYLLLNLSEPDHTSQTNTVDILPANAKPIEEKGIPSLKVKNLFDGRGEGFGPPSNTQLKEITAKIPNEIFAVWINWDCNLFIIDNRNKENPKLFIPNYYCARVFESANRHKTLWRAILFANIEDFLLAPVTSALSLAFRGIQ